MTFVLRAGGYARKLIPWIILAAALVPLFFLGDLFYPFVVPKTLLFQSVGLLAFACFLLAALSGEPFYYGRLRMPLAWLPATLLFVEYATSLIGIDFYRSFWGYFSRGDGLLTSTIAVLFTYLILLITDEAFIARFLKVIAGVGTLAAVLGAFEWLEYVLGFTFSFLPVAADRVGGTFGNAEFLAGYLSLSAFAAFAAANAPDVNARSKGLWYGLGFFQVLVVVLTATRGSILALTVALLFVLIGMAWKGSGGTRNAARVGLAALGVILVLGIFFRTPLSHSPFEPVRRIASISLTDATVSSRLYVWEGGLAEALKRPFTGYGAEHEAQIFDRFYDPSQLQEEWFDRFHNSFLDYFVEFGLLGLLLYGAMPVIAFLRASSRFRRTGDRYAGLFALAMLTYAVQDFFVFDAAASLFLMLAFFALTLSHADGAVAKRLDARFALLGIAAGASALLAFVPFVIRPLQADVDLGQAYIEHVADVSAANAYLSTGLTLGTYADMEYGYEAYDMYVGDQYQKLDGGNRVAAYREAEGILLNNWKRYPYDARTALYLAHLIDMNPPGAVPDEALEQKAAEAAIVLSPKRAQSWYVLANIDIGEADSLPAGSKKAGLYEDAIHVFRAYIAAVPNLAEPHFELAALYLAVGDGTSANTEATAGEAAYKPDLETAHRAAAYYLAAKDWSRASIYLEDVLAIDPNDDASKLDLAKARYLSGDVSGARVLIGELQASGSPYATSDPAFLSALGSK